MSRLFVLVPTLLTGGDARWRHTWLRIEENTFLFNVIADSTRAWSATMLPEDPKANTSGFCADELADHFGAKRK